MAAAELEVVDGAAGVANGGDFGVGGGVVGGSDAVGAGGDDGAIAHDDRGEGAALRGEDVARGEVDGLLHEDGIAGHFCGKPQRYRAGFAGNWIIKLWHRRSDRLVW